MRKWGNYPRRSYYTSCAHTLFLRCTLLVSRVLIAICVFVCFCFFGFSSWRLSTFLKMWNLYHTVWDILSGSKQQFRLLLAPPPICLYLTLLLSSGTAVLASFVVVFVRPKPTNITYLRECPESCFCVLWFLSPSPPPRLVYLSGWECPLGELDWSSVRKLPANCCCRVGVWDAEWDDSSESESVIAPPPPPPPPPFPLR